jgi:hypothetical protein
MKHQTLEELNEVAEVEASFPAMTRRQRLEHWAMLLERNPEWCLAPFPGTEYMTLNVRDKAQSPGLRAQHRFRRSDVVRKDWKTTRMAKPSAFSS